MEEGCPGLDTELRDKPGGVLACLGLAIHQVKREEKEERQTGNERKGKRDRQKRDKCGSERKKRVR